MYLGAMGAYGPIRVGGIVYSSYTPAIDAALATGAEAIASDGHVFQKILLNVPPQFGGGQGYLLDNCPINVVLGQGWLPNQIAVLKAVGITPACLVPGSAEYNAFFGGGTQQPLNVPVMEQPTAPTTFLTPPPQLLQVAASEYTGSGYTPSGGRILSTGVQVPAPTVIAIPGQPPQLVPPELPPQPGSATGGGMDWTSLLLMASVGFAALAALRSR